MHVIIGVEIRDLSAPRGPFLDARRVFSLASSATLPTCLDLTPGEGPPGGLLEGSCGRRKGRSMPHELNVGMYARLLPFQNTKRFSLVIRLRRRVWFGRVAKRGRRRACLLLRAQREWPSRARERNGCLTPVAQAKGSEQLPSFYVDGCYTVGGLYPQFSLPPCLGHTLSVPHSKF